ncbi:MAG: hypothetical protein MI892_02240, partial [Desulfobacterales bacterium]|nr:hypothetical protein [Desulfobacterales bacterium]
ISDIEKGLITKWYWSTDSELIEEIPQEKTYFEILNEQANIPNLLYSITGIKANQWNNNVDSYYNEFDCSEDMNSQIMSSFFYDEYEDECDDEKERGKLSQKIAIADLDYIIIVSNSPQKKYCEAKKLDKFLSTSYDLVSEVAEYEAKEIALSLADVTYYDEDLLYLIFLQPIKYRGVRDTGLYLPVGLQKHFLKTFKLVLESFPPSKYSKRFADIEISFDRNELLNDTSEEYHKAWINALAHPKGKIYFSPLLVRSPYILCYKSGVNDYVKTRYTFSKKISESNNSYGSFSEEDIKMYARVLSSFNYSYEECVRSQLYFIITHELGHIIARRNELTNATESVADCFAYIKTKRDTEYNFDLLEEILLRDNSMVSEIGKKKLNKRFKNLRKLEDFFSNENYPKDIKSTIDFCNGLE